MSKNYSVNQFEQEFAPKRLQSYQVPKLTLSQRPKESSQKQQPKQENWCSSDSNNSNSNSLSFIANKRGHLLPGVQKSSQNPFGDYVGTWDLPKSIPGPYHLVKTGRTCENVTGLFKKKENTNCEINQAKENQKPLSLQQQEQKHHHHLQQQTLYGN